MLMPPLSPLRRHFRFFRACCRVNTPAVTFAMLLMRYSMRVMRYIVIIDVSRCLRAIAMMSHGNTRERHKCRQRS